MATPSTMSFQWSIVVGPDPNTLAPGESQKLIATAFWPDDCMSELRSEDQADWTSDDDAVAEQDQMPGGDVLRAQPGGVRVRLVEVHVGGVPPHVVPDFRGDKVQRVLDAQVQE